MKRKSIIFLALTAILLIPAGPFLSGQEDSEEGIIRFLWEALPPQQGRIMSLDPITGVLTITDTPANHSFIQRLLEEIDKGTPQVTIETKFVEVSIGDIDELGMEWYWYKQGGINDDLSDIDIGTGSTEDSGIHWEAPDQPFPQTMLGLNLFLSSTTYSGDFIRTYLRALEQSGKANLLSAPRVTTLSGQMANIQIVSTFPYTSDVELENTGTADHPTWQYNYTINEESIGITLEVTPRVGEGSDVITLELHPRVDVLTNKVPISNLVPAEMGWPIVDTRSVQTTVYVRSGETLIMGGLMADDIKSYKRKIPILGNIPLLGNLFKYKYESKQKTNLLIFITATIITAEGGERGTVAVEKVEEAPITPTGGM